MKMEEDVRSVKGSFAWGLLPIAGALAIWEILWRIQVINTVLIPAPSTIVATAIRLCQTGELTAAIGATLTRMTAGFALGACGGLVLGIMMGAVATFKRLMNPIISILNSAPKLTLLPMFMLFMGIG